MNIWSGFAFWVKSGGRHLLLAVLALPLTAGGAGAQGRPGVTVLHGPDEEWAPPVFSGAQILGLQLPGRPAQDTLLSGAIPAGLAGQELCLNITGAGGHYRGSQHLKVVADWAGGLADVPYETTYREDPRDLPKLAPEEVVTKLSLGGCLDDNADAAPVLLLSAWRSAAEAGAGQTGGPVRLFINSVQNDRVILVPDAAEDLAALGGAVIPCTTDEDRGRAHTHICEIDAAALTDGQHGFLIRRFAAGDQRERTAWPVILWIQR